MQAGDITTPDISGNRDRCLKAQNKPRGFSRWRGQVLARCIETRLLIEGARVLTGVLLDEVATTTFRLLDRRLHERHAHAGPACLVVNNAFFYSRVDTAVAYGRHVGRGDHVENLCVDFEDNHAHLSGDHERRCALRFDCSIGVSPTNSPSISAVNNAKIFGSSAEVARRTIAWLMNNPSPRNSCVLRFFDTAHGRPAKARSTGAPEKRIAK
jgi:hypothetical protein